MNKLLQLIKGNKTKIIGAIAGAVVTAVVGTLIENRLVGKDTIEVLTELEEQEEKEIAEEAESEEPVI